MAFEKLKNIFKDESEEENLIGTEDEFYDISESEALKEADKTGNKMILLEPRAYSEAQQIADHLKNRNSVVVNLKRVTSDQAKRIIDFLSGCIYSIGGKMQKIGVGIYLCTPKNVNIQGKITDDSEKGKSSKSDNIDW
ncbi:MAG: cell division protein SepF [Firmicutes bacterium]|nr:cell division protein SepF [Bacillota bacterium]